MERSVCDLCAFLWYATAKNNNSTLTGNGRAAFPTGTGKTGENRDENTECEWKIVFLVVVVVFGCAECSLWCSPVVYFDFSVFCCCLIYKFIRYCANFPIKTVQNIFTKICKFWAISLSFLVALPIKISRAGN